MTTTPLHTTVIDGYVKVFLSCCHEMSPNPQTAPLWLEKGNLLSLLNMCDQIDKYGHLRFYWEGNRERFVQTVKPLLSNMRKSDTYFYHKMKELTSMTSIREILTNLDAPGKRHTEYGIKCYKPLKIYNNRDDVDTAIETHNCLSVGVIYERPNVIGTFVFAYSDADNVLAYKVQWHEVFISNLV